MNKQSLARDPLYYLEKDDIEMLRPPTVRYLLNTMHYMRCTYQVHTTCTHTHYTDTHTHTTPPPPPPPHTYIYTHTHTTPPPPPPPPHTYIYTHNTHTLTAWIYFQLCTPCQATRRNTALAVWTGPEVESALEGLNTWFTPHMIDEVTVG